MPPFRSRFAVFILYITILPAVYPFSSTPEIQEYGYFIIQNSDKANIFYLSLVLENGYKKVKHHHHHSKLLTKKLSTGFLITCFWGEK